MTTYTDNSQMPFGKYKGKALVNVPADYLLYLWENMYGTMADQSKPLSVYINDNLPNLKIEARELNKNKNR